MVVTEQLLGCPCKSLMHMAICSLSIQCIRYVCDGGIEVGAGDALLASLKLIILAWYKPKLRSFGQGGPFRRGGTEAQQRGEKRRGAIACACVCVCACALALHFKLARERRWVSNCATATIGGYAI